MEHPRLAEDGDDGCGGVDEEPHLIVGRSRDVLPSRRPEGREAGVAECPPPRLFEEFDVAGIAARPAALDVVDAKRVEAFGDAELVRNGKRHAFALRPVAQGRVVDFDGLVHGRFANCSPRLSRP